MINITRIKKYCTEYQKIENYEEAVKSPLRYDLHHRREISENKSRKQLIAENLYYGRPPEELIFLEHGEHIRLHKEGENNPMFGKNMSAETRQKISENNSRYWKGKPSPWLGKHRSPEARKKMSDAKKGRHWHLENGKHVWTE